MGFKTFEEIESWQEARKLMRAVRKICKKEIVKKEWAWIDQITRSALSVMANIAEGHDCQMNSEFIVFLGYAKRSAAEVRSHLYYALDEGFIDQKEFDILSEQTRKIGAQIAKLIAYLRINVTTRTKLKASNQLTSNEQQ